MIIGIGTDMCAVARMQTLLDRFDTHIADRCLTASERAAFDALPDESRAAFLAKRFAAKEAASKALGTGIAQGVTLKHFEVGKGPNGAPTLRLTGAAHERAAAHGPYAAHLSLTDDHGCALAFVVLETIDKHQ